MDEGPNASSSLTWPATTTSSQMAASGSLFSYAHSFSVNNPIMIERMQIYQEHSKISSALAWLEGHAMSGVEYHSSARSPPPRCYRGTRLRFIKTIRDWLDNPNSKQRLLWLYGPAGVGKSAISQTLAELLGKKAHLGATIFFSWPMASRNLSSPKTPFASRDVSAMWLTIAYRLSTTQPAYRTYVAECIGNDPKLVEQALEFQFETLFVEPFGRMKLINTANLLPIVIDGLDHCRHDVQQQIIRLILGFTEAYPDSPLVWILASRHEMHLSRLFDNYRHLGDRVQKLLIPIESEEALKDAEIFMRGRFDEMSEEYVALEPIPWPGREDFNHILTVGSGLFILISAIVNFIGNPHIADPMSQLTRVVSVTKRTPLSTGVDDALMAQIDPLAVVYDMYRQILTNIPKPAYRKAKRILGFYLLPDGFGDRAHDTTSFWHLCNILSVKEHDASGCLSQLHSLINIPRRESASVQPLLFFHESFAHYLLNREASKEFWIDLNEVVKDLWQCHLRMLRESNFSKVPSFLQIQLAWLNPSNKTVEEFQYRAWENARLTFFHHLLPCPTERCAFGIHLPDAGRDEGTLADILADVNFSNIVDGYVCPDMPYRFISFIHWLLEKDHPLLQERQLLFKLCLSEDNYNCIQADAVSFIIRSVRFAVGGCVTTFAAYTKSLPFHDGAATELLVENRLPPNGVERKRLFSVRERPKSFVQLLDHLRSHRAGITNAVVVGSADVGQCALLIDESEENETIYYILPWKMGM